MESETLVPIVPNLYCGNLYDAENARLLKTLKITHILSVGQFPQIPLCHIKHQYLDVLDMDCQNMIQYFNQAYDFIENATKDGSCLVHCQLGVSRAPTICISYLIRKYRMTLKEAKKTVKAARPIASPNFDFLKQLQQYERLCQSKAQDSTNCDDSENIMVNRQPSYTNGNNMYSCKICRTSLFQEADVVLHCIGQHTHSYKKIRKDIKSDSIPLTCTSWFIKRKDWMGDMTELQGDIACPKCHTRLGSWKWDGSQCSCGTWVAPFIQILKSRLDCPVNANSETNDKVDQ
ncbi:probable dual specificity protein phosphatase DDB_G0281963 [Schistocerca gregaria]|uniref:probable dual specificity protein phosphatase DDB_G0281963 n=1 Tax=Schistocerca gregaria TaxID=7010 RepID=UPI00211EDD17|nr:probable dual specificity protein phosphatase DDB_G0281963 [Schistocerca gregaria]